VCESSFVERFGGNGRNGQAEELTTYCGGVGEKPMTKFGEGRET